MAEVSYLKLESEKLGEIKGDCPEADYKEWIAIQAFDQPVERATHPQSGKVTGEAMHGALNLTKPIDKASPLLQQALSEGHRLKGEICFSRTSVESGGGKEHWYSIKFEGGSLVRIRKYKPSALGPDGELPDLEDVSVRAEKFTWRHELGSTEATDDWKNK